MNLHASRVVDLELPPHLVDDEFPLHAVYVEYEDHSDSFNDFFALEIINGVKRHHESVSADEILVQVNVYSVADAREKLEGVCIADLYDLPDEDVWFA